MGLTTVKDLDDLQKTLDEYKKKLKKLTAALQQQVDRLEKVVYVEDILQEEDTDWDIVRQKRNVLLAKTDWTMIAGATVDQRVWSIYRQILRDIPQTFKEAGPEKVVWPVPPSIEGPNTVTEIE